MIRPADRIRRLPHQLFAGLVAKIDDKRRQGLDVINLGQGNPDQPTPKHIIDALKAAADEPAYHRYISFRGLPALKAAVAEWYRDRYGVDLNPETEVAILIGSKIGLEEISLALLNAGDIALAPDPGYPDYWSGIALAGAELKPWRLDPAAGFLPNPAEITEDVRLAFLNYPNNPTGRVAPPAFYDQVIAQAAKTGTVLAHDLAYGDIVYDQKTAVSLLARPGGKEVGIEFTTLSKSYNMAGWRLGFAAGNATVIRYLELLQDHLHCSQFGAIQAAGIAALKTPLPVIEEVRNLYQARRDRFISSARENGWEIPPSAGSIFLWCPVPATKTAWEWAELLLEEAGVMVAPGTGFGEAGEGYVRIALTEPEDRLALAAQRIANRLLQPI